MRVEDVDSGGSERGGHTVVTEYADGEKGTDEVGEKMYKASGMWQLGKVECSSVG